MKKILRKILLCITAALCFCTVFQSVGVNASAADNVDFERKKIDIPYAETEFYNNYFASVPGVLSFFDYKGRCNVAFAEEKTLHIYRYNSKMKLLSELKIKNPLDMLGDVICDNKGNYYVCWGRNDNEHKNINVITVTKYDYKGNKLASKSFKGYDLYPWGEGKSEGTRLPFDAGTCEMAISGNTLACNFAREMYNGHQSNMVFYLDCETLKRKTYAVPYSSHAFDQSCIATTDGGFLMANQGDAYPRGFMISKIDTNKSYSDKVVSFHFREGSNRWYGYNDTFAQLGGIVETQSAYVLCGSSDRTLSLDLKRKEESRDMFVQFLKKDFYDYSGSEMYYVKGESRTVSGKRPESTGTELFLVGNEKDYGVIWLTNYKGKYLATNPKIVKFDEDKIVVMWEKRSISEYEFVASYYTILNEDGTVYSKTKKIGKYTLPADSDIALKGTKLYWVTGEFKSEDIYVDDSDYTMYMNILDIQDVDDKEHSYKTKIVAATLKKDGKTVKECTECGKVKETAIPRVKTVKLSQKSFAYDGKVKKPAVTVTDAKGKLLRNNTDYTVTYPEGRKKIGEYKVTVKFKGKYKGSKTLTFKINPDKALFEMYSYWHGATEDLAIYWNEAKGAGGYILEYSKSSKFNKKNTKKITVKNKKTTMTVIEDIGFSKNIYFRIRAYKIVNKKKYYSDYDYITVPAHYYYT